MDRSTMLERLKWLAEAEPGTPPPNWIEENWACSIPEVAQAALAEIQQHEYSFELRWNADMRAIKRW
ncbi:hypothetical protein [Bradyrhizobium arachidis]|uniref:Uncharacterized protein n=1 Tax=Bradyrhizobium arachidis TaxID=858423 RepID=A0AAE7NTM4_9BRAD|nr:hypothetical protein [Bradyrhizobium arachidis]QOZ69333.1 hypothetical protein WN72_25725 [Bradyrhizobium arachidis]SFV19862.1 hypothetical protein SAMN05192541_1703 [Bradyrhizobium arachidis]